MQNFFGSKNAQSFHIVLKESVQKGLLVVKFKESAREKCYLALKDPA